MAIAGVAPCATHRPATHEAWAPQSLSKAHMRGGGVHDMPATAAQAAMAAKVWSRATTQR